MGEMEPRSWRTTTGETLGAEIGLDVAPNARC